MLSQEPLSRSGIISRADISHDVLTFWVRRGLVRPIDAPAGTGRHLRFEWYEANIAAVMNQLRQLGVPVDGLLSVAASFRDAIGWAEHAGINSVDDMFALWDTFSAHQMLDRGRISEAELKDYIDSASREDLGVRRITPRIQTLHASISKAEFDLYLDPYLTIMEQPSAGEGRIKTTPDLSYFWRVGDQWRVGKGESAPEAARRDGVPATIAIDVPTVIFNVWNRP